MSERSLLMLPLANLMPPLPGLGGGWDGSTKTYAPSPVWRDSTTDDVKFSPMPKKQAVKLYHRARDFERRTRQPGRQDGAIGRNGLALLHAMIFDFLDFRTGQLDPAQETIAKKAGISLRSAARGLANLKLSGVLNWVRRCSASFINGRYTLEQDTNAYAILPSSQWLGYVEPPEAPAPQSGTWGDHPCAMREPLTEAVTEQRQGGGTEAVIRQLELDRPGTVAAALASLGRAMIARKP
ncbi:MAG TPA: hypothetical protein VKF42_11360 [Chitinivibrionales bacterium]|nr:hypothetical protein [Chitinivibrionales bacterium]